MCTARQQTLGCVVIAAGRCWPAVPMPDAEPPIPFMVTPACLPSYLLCCLMHACLLLPPQTCLPGSTCTVWVPASCCPPCWLIGLVRQHDTCLSQPFMPMAVNRGRWWSDSGHSWCPLWAGALSEALFGLPPACWLGPSAPLRYAAPSAALGVVEPVQKPARAHLEVVPAAAPASPAAFPGRVHVAVQESRPVLFSCYTDRLLCLKSTRIFKSKLA